MELHVFPAPHGVPLRRYDGHGFRSLGRTVIGENLPDIHHDVVEAQLACGKSGPLGAVYDRADYMAQRVRMMQTWANYLDKLRSFRFTAKPFNPISVEQYARVIASRNYGRLRLLACCFMASRNPNVQRCTIASGQVAGFF